MILQCEVCEATVEVPTLTFTPITPLAVPATAGAAAAPFKPATPLVVCRGRALEDPAEAENHGPMKAVA